MRFRKTPVLFVNLVLALGGVAFYLWLRPYDLETERAAARAAGIPLSATDFIQRPIPAERNAAVEYNALMALWKRKPLVQGSVISGSYVPRSETALLRAAVRSRPDVSLLVNRAASKPEYFKQHNLHFDELLPDLYAMRRSADWLRAESLVLARDGRYPEAVRRQALVLNIARQAGQDPSVVAFLVSRATEAVAVVGFRNLLYEAGDVPGVAEAVKRELSHTVVHRNLARSLCYDTLCMTVFIDDIVTPHDTPPPVNSGAKLKPLPKSKSSDDRDPIPSLLGIRLMSSTTFLHANEAVILHWMIRFVAAARQPLASRAAAVRHVESEYRTAMAQSSKRYAQSWAYSMADPLPVIAKIGDRDAVASDSRLVTIAGAEVLAYRSRHGRYPATLEQAGSPSVNPATGHKLTYWSEGYGFTVFTRIDTVGEELRSTANDARSLQFRYPRPEGQ